MKRNGYSIFKAVSDPTRREIINLLVLTSSGLSINEISSKFAASRQAITKHIKLMSAAGLIDIEQRGRERYCHVDVTPLKEVFDWVSYYERFWEQKLDSLESYLRGTREKPD